MTILAYSGQRYRKTGYGINTFVEYNKRGTISIQWNGPGSTLPGLYTFNSFMSGNSVFVKF